MATETEEGWTTTAWRGQYPKRGGLTGTDTGVKSGAIGHLKGPSVAMLTAIQVSTKHILASV